MGERLAILIGNSEFESDSGLASLKFPGNDVKDLAAVLRDQSIGCFEVIEVIDQSSVQIKLAIEKALKQNLGAFVVIYYSGHGMVSDSGRLYLAARETEEDSLVSTAVRFDDIMDIKDNTGHGRVGIILDCCFAGLGQESIKGSTEDQVKALVAGRGIFFMGASGSTQPAKEDDNLHHGVLTAAILDGLKDGKAARTNDGIIRVSDLFQYCAGFIRDRGGQVPVCVNRTEGVEIAVAFSQPKISSTELAEVRAKLTWCRENKLLTDQDLTRLEKWFTKDPVPVAGKLSLETGFIRYVRGDLALPDLERFRDYVGESRKSLAGRNVDGGKGLPEESRLRPVESDAALQTTAVGRPQGGNAMIEQAWNDYRGWAKRARSLQASADSWNFWAMAALVLTAFLGAATTFVGTVEFDWPASPEIARALACAATVASALSLFVGRGAFSPSAQSDWQRCRATAETIKSECFRFAAGVGEYSLDNSSNAGAANAFIERRKAIAAQTARDSLTPEHDPVESAGDDRRPSRPMADQWYLSKRIDGQIDYYMKGQEKNEHAYNRIQLWSFVAGALVIAVSASAAFYGAGLAAWTSMLTTVGAAVSAYVLAERQPYLAGSYSAMKANLERTKERYQIGGMPLEALVATVEDLMESEHAAWIDQMAKTARTGPSPSPQLGESQHPAPDGTEPKTN